METTGNIMIYDDACPMCAAYTKAFVSTNLLSKEGRQSFSNIDADWLSQIATIRCRHEIPLINTKSNTVLYGIDAMLEVLGNKFPLIKRIGTCKPVHFFLKKLYKLISYNRRVITASAAHSTRFDCRPDFNFRYRVLLLCIGFCFNTLMLFPTYHHVFVRSVFNGASLGGLQMAHFALVSFNVLLSTKLSRNKAIDFLGQINLIGMIYSLLMLPLIWLNWLFLIPHLVNTVLLFTVFFLMINEYRRRMKYADVCRDVFIVISDAVSAVLFLGYLAFA